MFATKLQVRELLDLEMQITLPDVKNNRLLRLNLCKKPGDFQEVAKLLGWNGK
jgi:hypothetical protein